MKFTVPSGNKNKTKKVFKKFCTGFKLPTLPLIENDEIDYQGTIESKNVKMIKELIDITSQSKGRFVMGNPTRTKVIFAPKRKQPMIFIEDRNQRIWSYEQPVDGETHLRDYKFAITYKMFRLLPDANYSFQHSSKQFLSEWFIEGTNKIMSIELTTECH